MAIQFRCPGCSEPIEVDDEHAGRVAGCPYCQQVVTVPASSTYGAEEVLVARPMGAEPGAPPPAPTIGQAAGAGPLTPREELGLRLGHYAFVCAVIAVVLLVATVAVSISAGIGSMTPTGTGTGDETSATQPATGPSSFQREYERTQELILQHPWMGALSCGSQLFSMAALGLGLASISMCRRQNWRGITALIVSATFVVCMCSSILIQLVFFAGG